MQIRSQVEDNLSGVHLWLVLMKTYRVLLSQAETSIARTGMCFSDFAILEILLHKGPLPVNVLAARIGLTSGSGTTAVDRLQRRGLVARRTDGADRRARVVHLTPEGKTLIEGAFRRHSKAMEESASILSSEERTRLLSLLRKLGKGRLPPAGPQPD